MSTHIARKRFGQNFLQDQNVIANIVRAIAPSDQDCLIEIGPGLAALTEPLLERLTHMHVVELDRDLVARLQKRFSAERLTIHSADALEFDFLNIDATGKTQRKVVGNLPYNISSPLLFHLAEYAPHIDVQVFMLQKEVIERMVAAPKVTSAVVRMYPRKPEQLLARDEAHLSKLVAQAFSQRRKMLRNTLSEMVTQSQLEACGIAPTARAEELSVAQFVGLSNYLIHHTEKP